MAAPLLDALAALALVPSPGPAAPPAASITLAAAPVVVAADGSELSETQALDALAATDVVYVGEQHDQAAHHALQARLVRQLARRGPVFIGLEMLDATMQPQLDAYLSGRMSEAEFAELWKKAWGFPFELYRPIFEAAKEAGVPMKALNAPLSLVRKVAKTGLDSLTPDERAQLPRSVVQSSDPRYVEYVRQSAREHESGPPDAVREGRMLEAMAVWNEAMGQRVADGLAEGRRAIIVAGMGHVLFRAGIVESVRRRSSARQAVVLPYPKKPEPADRALADFFWLLAP
jgi:uncharacterized iron-regulated protein